MAGAGLRANRDSIATRQIAQPATGPAPDSSAPTGTVPLANVINADDLKAIEALAGTSGLLAKTAANTWALRQLSVPAALLGITNPAGVAGDPTLSLPVRAANLVFAGPGSGADAAPAFRSLVAADLPFTIATYSPTFTFATPGNLSVSYATQEGRYLRLGRLVVEWGRVTITPTHTTASGEGRFAVALAVSADSFIPIIAAQVSNAVTFPAGTTQALGGLIGGAQYFTISSVGTGAAAAQWGTAQFPTATARTVRWVAVYLVD